MISVMRLAVTKMTSVLLNHFTIAETRAGVRLRGPMGSSSKKVGSNAEPLNVDDDLDAELGEFDENMIHQNMISAEEAMPIQRRAAFIRAKAPRRGNN